jgi:hypothetical protein
MTVLLAMENLPIRDDDTDGEKIQETTFWELQNGNIYGHNSTKFGLMMNMKFRNTETKQE